MLACNAMFNIKELKYPVLVSSKKDGIRAFILRCAPWTRECKNVPNRAIRALLSRADLERADGELVVEGLSFHETQAIVMTEDAPLPEAFRYYVFDYIGDIGYQDRVANLVQYYGNIIPQVVPLLPRLVKSAAELQTMFNDSINKGEEGLIVRSLDGPYKQGRSTLGEGYMLKLVEWVIGEALCTGVNELLHNTDTATTRKLNQVKGGVLGSLTVEHKTYGTFHIGSGFTQARRVKYWNEPPIGKVVKFKFKPYGVKNAPRTPIFMGLI